MMPHSNCIESGCRLNFVQNSLSIQPPKFAIGSRVSSLWVDEFNNLHCDVGFIIGIFPAEKDWTPGWWYVVRLDIVDDAPWLTLPYDDERHESDLELSSIE